MLEIERKFLIKNDLFVTEATQKSEISQGYLNSNPERTVRIRIKGKQGFITIKGKSNDSGTTRFEWEKEIPLQEAQELITLCEEHVIVKTRYIVPQGIHKFEIDVFHGDNEGLVIAEIELSEEDEHFDKPVWLGEEVTNQVQYYNAYLSNKPYTKW